jgi:Concanavalin A-like lectin/glucanases superfamily
VPAPMRRRWAPRANRPPHGPAQVNRASPQADGLVAWWPALASDQSAARDLAGRGFDAAFQGGTPPTWGSLAEGWQALDLGSGGGYAEAADDDLLSPAANLGAITVAAWVNVTAWPSGGQNRAPIVAKGNGGTGANAYEYALYVNGASPAEGNAHSVTGVVWKQDGATYWEGSADADAVSLGVTYHVAFTLGPDAAQIALFQDGLTVGSGVFVGGTLTAGDSPVDLGRRPDGATGQTLNALLADVRVYSRALSPAEIWQLYDPPTRWDLYAGAAGLDAPGAAPRASLRRTLNAHGTRVSTRQLHAWGNR